LLLERLSPLERAVFVLREVFGFGYPEIASAVGRSEAACRQLARALGLGGGCLGDPPRGESGAEAQGLTGRATGVVFTAAAPVRTGLA
jgi:Sigma-70, region 4